MQKIISQELGGSVEQAIEIAQYTWSEGEEAWFYDPTWKDVFKVKFTGKHWLIGNKWGRRKIYQYYYHDSSGDHDLKRKGLDENGISHDEEDVFYTTKQEAVDRAYKSLLKERDYFMMEYEKNILKISQYEHQ